MRLRKTLLIAGAFAILVSGLPAGSSARGQQQQQPARTQGEGTPTQRLEVLRQRLETSRRTLNGAIAGLNAGDDKGKKDKTPAADDPATRLRGLEKEASSLLGEVNDIRSRVDRAEKFEATDIDKLESAHTDLNGRVDAGLQASAGARRNATVAAAGDSTNKKKKRVPVSSVACWDAAAMITTS